MKKKKQIQTPAAETADAQTPKQSAVPDAQALAPWYDRLEQAWQALGERAPFSYDPAQDPLYAQYRDQYVQLGRSAMEDTMGRAAALTGGYDSSYGQQAGQQAYHRALEGLGEVVPSLYAQAQKAYDSQTDALEQQLQTAQAGVKEAQAQQAQERQNAREFALLMLQSGLMPSGDVLAQAGISQQDAQSMQRYYAALLAAQRYGK